MENTKDANYTLADLYLLQDSGPAARFDELRWARALPPYFHDDAGNFQAQYTRAVLLDDADLDKEDRAFLFGVQAEHVSGIRLPWPYQDRASHPIWPILSKYFQISTVWPGSHALIVVDLELLTFVADFCQHCELTR